MIMSEISLQTESPESLAPSPLIDHEKNHRSWDKSLFVRLEEAQGGSIIFGDGNMTKIIGKRTIEFPSIPILIDVLYVQGLKINFAIVFAKSELKPFFLSCLSLQDKTSP